jgi:hypothetical protein
MKRTYYGALYQEIANPVQVIDMKCVEKPEIARFERDGVSIRAEWFDAEDEAKEFAAELRGDLRYAPA